MRWQPVVLMVALLVLAVWLVTALGSDDDVAVGSGERAVQLRIGTGKTWVVVQGEGSDVTFRIGQPGTEELAASRALSPVEFRELFGDEILANLSSPSPNWAFRILNITGWASLLWVGLGFVGQAAFFARMLVQWLASERKRESVVPVAFWWLSLIGGVMLFVYFVWRRDLVGVLGQTTGVVVYARNLRLIYRRQLGVG